MMQADTIRHRLVEEINRLPADRLQELYDLVHFFRIGLESQPKAGQSVLELAGSWADMPESEFRSMEEEIRVRRKSAFGSRPR